MAVVTYNATGRRKSSVARVRLVPGEGKIIINQRELDDYFGLKTLELIVNQPLELTETKGKYDVLVNVIGGGVSGQAGAIRHGIARALLKVDEEFRPALKKQVTLLVTRVKKNAVNMASKKPVKQASSPNANIWILLQNSIPESLMAFGDFCILRQHFT